MQVLQTHLLARHAAGKQVVIFVEEAQGMPLATLEEIRLLSNLETKHDKLLQIVLFGQPELDENLNQTNIRQLRERITHSFNLSPLKQQEIGEYLIFRLRAAGYFGPHLFSKVAIAKMAGSAQGLVRRVNILADKSLLAAYAENVYQVTPKHVLAAIGDSEFGAEKAKRATKQMQWLMWASLLALGLALGYTASLLWQNKLSVPQTQLKAVITPMPEKLALAPNSSPKPSSSAATPTIPAPATVATTALASALPTAVANSTVANTVVVTQDDILSRRLSVTTAWLTAQPPTTVSIQLLGAASDAQVKTDIERLSQQIELDNIYVYRTKVNNLPFLSVLYGNFVNRFEATQALQKLPAEIQKNRPQLRTIAGVLQETK